MEIKVSDFITAVTEEKFNRDAILATLAQVEDLGIADSLAPIMEKMMDAIKQICMICSPEAFKSGDTTTK